MININKPLPVILTTKEAAKALNRQPQTLRKWSILGHPIKPVRINGRLAWRRSDIEKLIEGVK
tara:strand:+ start:1588 stop:1776 length:189 start_codon:yes stop_codon:yes gene_type:complete